MFLFTLKNFYLFIKISDDPFLIILRK